MIRQFWLVKCIIWKIKEEKFITHYKLRIPQYNTREEVCHHVAGTFSCQTLYTLKVQVLLAN